MIQDSDNTADQDEGANSAFVATDDVLTIVEALRAKGLVEGDGAGLALTTLGEATLVRLSASLQ